MAGKKKSEKESSWIGEIEKYSRQIWLAGLGAYSKVSKDGSKLFETLVKDGEKAEKEAKSDVDAQVGAAKASARSAKSKVDEVRDRALGKWSELEEAFDKRLNSAISRLGVPSRNEVKELHGKVDTLTRQIEKLTGVSVKRQGSGQACGETCRSQARREAGSQAGRCDRRQARGETCRQAGCEKACGEEAGRSRRVFERARCPRRHTGCQRSGSERSGDAEQPGLSPGGNAHARHSPGVFHSGPR